MPLLWHIKSEHSAMQCTAIGMYRNRSAPSNFGPAPSMTSIEDAMVQIGELGKHVLNVDLAKKISWNAVTPYPGSIHS